MKCKKCFSLDEKTIASISRVSAQMGLPESEIVNKSLDKALSHSTELTSAERYHFQRNSINLALDNVLLLFGIRSFEGGLSEKYKVALYVAHGNNKAKTREYRNGIMEVSLFEILEQIRELDINIWGNLTTVMAQFGQIRKRYLDLYPKKVLPRKIRIDTITNNNTSITNNTNTSIEDILKRKELRKEKNNPNTNPHDDKSVTEIKKPIYSDEDIINPT